jgi:signal transduction histidine kinase
LDSRRRDLADLIKRKNAQLVIEGSLPTAIGDPPRITQLLANLVGNALKYNTSASPLVVIGQGPRCPAPATVNGAFHDAARAPAWMSFPQVTLFVRDNGIGIEPRHHEQIFGIFRRLHTADEYEGSGAGLAICKKIVEGHAGRIWVDSQPGQGATF